jgi:hypothetical protein
MEKILETSRGKLLQEQQGHREHLNIIRSQFAFHIVEDHRGVPATSCHKCINYRQGILADNEVLRDIEKELTG